MKIACVYGPFSQGLNGPFAVEDVFVRRGLTGSESCFFNTMRGLAELGHVVQGFAAITSATPVRYGHAEIFDRDRHSFHWREGFDAVLAWNEPDMLRGVKGALRVCVQQLNDFSYCQPGWDEHVDLYASPSQHHAEFMQGLHERKPIDGSRIDPARSCWVPNSVNLEMFQFDPPPERKPHSVAYCSSPDRGLHQLLGIWPEVRRRVDDAELHVYYNVERWIGGARWQDNEHGRRARWVAEAFKRLGVRGENGLVLHDQQPNVAVYRALSEASIMAYPCDPILYTEGFGVAVLDACAAGCIPIISDADAMASIFGMGPAGGPACVIPWEADDRGDLSWSDIIEAHLVDSTIATDAYRQECRDFAARFSRQAVAARWDALLSGAQEARRAA